MATLKTIHYYNGQSTAWAVAHGKSTDLTVNGGLTFDIPIHLLHISSGDGVDFRNL